MEKVYIGDVGTIISLDTGVSLSGATVTINAIRPNGTSVVWTAAPSGTSVNYTVQTGDINMAGVWKINAVVVTSLGHWTGETVAMPVYNLGY